MKRMLVVAVLLSATCYGKPMSQHKWARYVSKPCSHLHTFDRLDCDIDNLLGGVAEQQWNVEELWAQMIDAGISSRESYIAACQKIADDHLRDNKPWKDVIR